MTLKIEISNVNSSQAVDFISACRDVQDILNEKAMPKDTVALFNLIGMQFEFKDDPQPVFRGDDMPFARYLNSTKKE